MTRLEIGQVVVVNGRQSGQMINKEIGKVVGINNDSETGGYYYHIEFFTWCLGWGKANKHYNVMGKIVSPIPSKIR